MSDKYCKVCKKRIEGNRLIATTNNEFYCKNCARKKFSISNIKELRDE